MTDPNLTTLEDGWITVKFKVVFRRTKRADSWHHEYSSDDALSRTSAQRNRPSPFLKDRLVYIEVLTDDILNRYPGSHFPLDSSVKYRRVYLIDGNETISYLNRKVRYSSLFKTDPLFVDDA